MHMAIYDTHVNLVRQKNKAINHKTSVHPCLADFFLSSNIQFKWIIAYAFIFEYILPFSHIKAEDNEGTEMSR